jgi:hypothetical protein
MAVCLAVMADQRMLGTIAVKRLSQFVNKNVHQSNESFVGASLEADPHWQLDSDAKHCLEDLQQRGQFWTVVDGKPTRHHNSTIFVVGNLHLPDPQVLPKMMDFDIVLRASRRARIERKLCI